MGKYLIIIFSFLLILTTVRAEEPVSPPNISARRPKVSFNHSGTNGIYKDIELRASIFQRVGNSEELFQEISANVDVVIENSVLLKEESEEFFLVYGVRGPEIDTSKALNVYEKKYQKGVFTLTGKSRKRVESLAGDFLVYFKREGSRLTIQLKDVHAEYLKSIGENSQLTLEYTLKKDSGSAWKRNPVIETKKIVIENDNPVALVDGANLDTGALYLLTDVKVARIASKFYLENLVWPTAQPAKIQF